MQVQQTSPHGKAGTLPARLFWTLRNMTVSELGERRLLARIRERLPKQAAGVVVGIGDDGAVVTAGRNVHTVLTVDNLVEGVHFNRTLSTPGDIGHKALAVNLSDLAAMGATPQWALLSLALPDNLSVDDVDAMVDGLARVADQFGVAIIGGNLTKSPGPLVVDVTAVGQCHPRRCLTRSGGRPGDELYVSGTVGGGAAGLEMLQAKVAGPTGAQVARSPAPPPPEQSFELGRACVERYRRPLPRIRLGQLLASNRAVRAAMDLSDGLADAADQIAEASGCGVEIDAVALPIDADARRWWESRGEDAVRRALAGGDDYELLTAAPRAWRGRLRHVRSRVSDPPLTRVGVLTRDRDERVLVRDGRREPLPAGFAHW
jgi:thiamine-monophosphate kinase